VGYWEIPDAIQRMQSEVRALKTELKAAREQLIDAEARSLASAATMHGDLRIIARAFDQRDVNDLKLLTQKLTEQPGTVALVGLAGDKAQLLFGRANNVNLDMAKLLKGALTVLKSDKGGGRPSFAQGGGVPASLADVTGALNQAEQAIRADGKGAG